MNLCRLPWWGGRPEWAAHSGPNLDLAREIAGRAVTNSNFAGRFQLVFFGVSTCPDICPTTLAEVADVIGALWPGAARLPPLFISVDPERGAGAGLADYAAACHPAILGLRFSADATRAKAASFKIANQKKPLGETCFLAHSAALYLIGPDGEWLRQFDYAPRPPTSPPI